MLACPSTLMHACTCMHACMYPSLNLTCLHHDDFWREPYVLQADKKSLREKLNCRKPVTAEAACQATPSTLAALESDAPDPARVAAGKKSWESRRASEAAKLEAARANMLARARV